MARPTIRMWEVVDVAQTAEPGSPPSEKFHAEAKEQIPTGDKYKNADAVGGLQREQRIDSPKDGQECEPG